MKYIVSVEMTTLVEDIEIEVDEFDQDKMAQKAAEQFRRDAHCPYEINILDTELDNWNLID